MSAKRSKAQRTHTARLLMQNRPRSEETIASAPPHHPKTRGQTAENDLRTHIQEQDARILELEVECNNSNARAVSLALEVAALKATLANLETVNRDNDLRLSAVTRELDETGSALTDTAHELWKAKKRTQRLTREKAANKRSYAAQRAHEHATHQKTYSDVSGFLRDANANVAKLEASAHAVQMNITKEQAANVSLRKKCHRLDMQRLRAQQSLDSTRRQLTKLGTWKPTKHGVYTPEARRLARALLRSGCSGERVGAAINACARAFNIRVTRTMSSRTVFRSRDEGGLFGYMQLGREVIKSDGFGEGSDGTTDHKTTFESHHITLACPTYLPGVDDSDKSTWQTSTRFVAVEPALDHTAQTQFEGTKALAEKMASAYSNSPLAKRDGDSMEADDFIRKNEFQHMDHASDGKKKLNKCREWKKEVLTQDAGQEVLEALESGEFLASLSRLTKEDIEEARQQAANEAESSGSDADRGTAERLLAKLLGQNVVNSLPERERELLLAITFAGCCGHKDLNALKYGVAKMMAGWEKRNRPPPILLANKGNDSTIRLGTDSDSAAVTTAVDASTRGGIKLASLAGSLFNNSDDKKGYQDIHRNFMSLNKKELYGLNDSARFPDTSNTRYQSHSYAAAELITFLELYTELLEHVRDGKHKPGFNHMEENVYKALQDPSTITELAAITLYGVTVSWPYLRNVRGENHKVRNLLDPDLVDLHRRLPSFCEYIAANPLSLLEENISDFSKVTLDSKPFLYSMAVMSIKILAPELPDLGDCISDLFSGCANGWRHFTEEFQPGGPFDMLSAEQRARIFIPATNDCSEGALGGWRVHSRYHPNSTAAGFSNQTRLQRNNTEAFVDKLCNEDDHKYVREAVRVQGASGEHVQFKKHLLETQRKRVREKRRKDAEALSKKSEELARLSTVGLCLDRVRIQGMLVPELQDQLKIHRLLLGDEVLPKVRQKDLKNKMLKMYAVLAAVTRNQEKVDALIALIEKAKQAQDSGNTMVPTDNSGEENDAPVEDEYDVEEEEYF